MAIIKVSISIHQTHRQKDIYVKLTSFILRYNLMFNVLLQCCMEVSIISQI